MSYPAQAEGLVNMIIQNDMLIKVLREIQINYYETFHNIKEHNIR